MKYCLCHQSISAYLISPNIILLSFPPPFSCLLPIISSPYLHFSYLTFPVIHPTHTFLLFTSFHPFLPPCCPSHSSSPLSSFSFPSLSFHWPLFHPCADPCAALNAGSTYNIPVCIWLLDNHPFSPPMVYVKPTPDMLIKASRHVDQNGKVFLPYLHEWNLVSESGYSGHHK